MGFIIIQCPVTIGIACVFRRLWIWIGQLILVAFEFGPNDPGLAIIVTDWVVSALVVENRIWQTRLIEKQKLENE